MSIFGILGKAGQASAMLAFFTLLAKFSGLWRDRILASQFGASSTLDVYYSAFRIPDLIFNLLIIGAISSAFIPLFIERRREDERKAWTLAQNFLNVALAAVAVAAVCVMAFARPLSFLVAPGFNPQERGLLVGLMRLMAVSPIIFSVSTILGSVLNALERFTAYAIAPILYNAGIIIGAYAFAPWVAARGYDSVYGLGLGVLAGAVLHMAVQLPSALAAGFRFGAVFRPADPMLGRMARLMAPRAFALGAYQIGLTVTGAIASVLGSGSITVLNLATNLQAVPLSVLGISIATVLFPQLSAHAADGDMAEFRRKLRRALWGTFGAVTGAAVAIFFLRREIVGIVLAAGVFSGGDQELTAEVLGIFMVSVVAQSLMHVMTRAFYALQNTRTPFVIAMASIAIVVGAGYAFALPFGWGVRGLAWAIALAYNMNFLLLYISFRRRYS